MKKNKRKCIVMLGLLTCIILGTKTAYAGEYKGEETSYQECILESNLSLEDKTMLLQSQEAKTNYEKMEEEGWVLQDVEVEDMDEIVPQAGNISTYRIDAIVRTTSGKVVYNKYVQAAKKKTYYNNQIYRRALDVKKYASFASNFIPYKWAWIASTLFGIDTSQCDAYFNSGYQRVEENATYYTRDAYYKVKNRYWLGYSVSKMSVSVSILSYYRDAKGTSHQKTHSKNNVFKSRGYNLSDQYLISLAKKHYNGKYVEEHIIYPSNSGRYRIN